MFDTLSFDDEYTIMEATLETEVRTATNMFHIVMLQHDNNMAQAEYKVLTESGTDEDLEMLYMEATEQANQKSEGIFSKIFTAIRNFLSGIKEKITKFFTGKKESDVDKNAKVNAPADPNKVATEGSKLMSKGQALLSKINSGVGDFAKEVGDFVDNCNAFVKLGGLVITGAGAFKFVKTLLTKTDEAKEKIDKCETIFGNIKDPKKKELAMKVINGIKNISTKIGNTASGLMTKIPWVGKKKQEDEANDKREALKNKAKKQIKQDRMEKYGEEVADNVSTPLNESAEDDFTSALSAIYDAL